ncbi:MAG TPA: AI-2E family transporter [Bryobacteraceae bacterium]|nr:AI-2E family transporter [Bryobacteraceae bacterium]
MPGLDSRAARAAWTAILIVLGLLTLYRVRQTLLVFVIALLFAHLLQPLMDLISRRFPSRTRTPALAVTFLLVLALVGALLGLIGTVVVRQAANLAKAAPAFIDRMQQAPPPAEGAVESLGQQAARLLENQFRAHYSDIASLVPRISLQVLSASRNLIYLIIIPILSFFMLRDGRGIRGALLDLFPARRAAAEAMLDDIHLLLLQYMRALLLLSCSTFTVFTLVLSLLGVSYAILLAAIAFLLEFVPLVGPLAAALIVLAVSAASGYPHLLWLGVFLAVFRMLQDYALSPVLMSRGVALHPLMVIFGVFAGGEIGGIAGVFLSVPVLALARLLYRHLRSQG